MPSELKEEEIWLLKFIDLPSWLEWVVPIVDAVIMEPFGFFDGSMLRHVRESAGGVDPDGVGVGMLMEVGHQ